MPHAHPQPTPAAGARRRPKAGASHNSTGRVSRTRPVPFDCSKIRLTVDELIDPAPLPERCLLYRQIKEAMIRRPDCEAASWFRDLQKAHEELSGRTRNPKHK